MPIYAIPGQASVAASGTIGVKCDFQYLAENDNQPPSVTEVEWSANILVLNGQVTSVLITYVSSMLFLTVDMRKYVAQSLGVSPEIVKL